MFDLFPVKSRKMRQRAKSREYSVFMSRFPEIVKHTDVPRLWPICVWVKWAEFLWTWRRSCNWMAANWRTFALWTTSSTLNTWTFLSSLWDPLFELGSGVHQRGLDDDDQSARKDKIVWSPAPPPPPPSSIWSPDRIRGQAHARAAVTLGKMAWPINLSDI